MQLTHKHKQSQTVFSFFILLIAYFGNAQNPFPTGAFTLPNGKSIAISYEVIVNSNACPSGTVPTNISNQSQVMGSNFMTVFTDDPDIAGTSNPTISPFGGISIGNLIFNDVNRNGVFDGGDSGLNGVVVNLYLDNGNGVLDALDGSPIAMSTTVGGGLYAFNVCPGTYIVEVAATNFAMGGALYNGGAPFISSPLGGAPDPDTDNTDNDDNGDPVIGFGVATAAFTVAYNLNPMLLSEYNYIDLGFKTPTTVSINSVALNEGTGAGPTAIQFTVTRNDNSEAFSLAVNTSDLTATTSDNDYTTISNGMVSFTAGGSLTATVTVNVNHDNKVEQTETFNVVLSGAPAGVLITNAIGTGTINNDDAATVSVASDISQAENGGNQTFTITISNPVDVDVSVLFSTSNGTAATTDIDYNAIVSQNVTFLAGTTIAQTVTVTINNDNKVELDETYSVTIGSLSASGRSVNIGTAMRTGTIENDDAATVNIAADVSQLENAGNQTFNVTLSNPVDAEVMVLFSTSNGTATTADSDFAAIVNQSVTFPINTTSNQTVTVTINSDNKVEDNEVYNVSIGTLSASGRSVTLGSNTSRTGTILNDDVATVTLSPVGGVPQNEGNSIVTNFTFTATVDNPVQGGFTLGFSTADGTATSPSDYTGGSANLTFNGTANQALNIDIGVNGDLEIEDDETFTVSLTTVSGTTAIQAAAINIAGSPKTGTILNDEKDWGDAPTAAQSGFANSYPTTFAQNGARHDLMLNGLRLGATVDADLDGQPNTNATGDGADEDGVTLPTSFVLGVTSSITVNASENGILNAWIDWNRNGVWTDAGEQVFTNQIVVAGNNTLNIATPMGASLGTSYARFRLSTASGIAPTGSAPDGEVEDYQINIQNIAISINDVSIMEGNVGTTNALFTVSLNNPAPAGGVTFDIATADGTATVTGNDYTSQSLTGQVIPEGMSTYTFTVVLNGDNIVENNETFFVNVTNVVGAGVADAQGIGTINNDDTATLTFSGGSSESESVSPRVFTATLSAPVQGGFQVNYKTENGVTNPAIAGLDYTDNDGMLTFVGNAGEMQSFNVVIMNDNVVELDETFTAELGAILIGSFVQESSIFIVDGNQTETIENDDAAVVNIATDVSQLENAGNQTFNVTLSNPVDAVISVLFNTTNGTATTTDNDYNAVVSHTVTFPANTMANQMVSVTINNDNKVEDDETYTVGIGSLSAAGRNVTFGTSSRTGTILNDDNTTLTLTPTGGVMQNEGNSGTTNFVFMAELTNPVQGGFTVAYTTNDGTATNADNDYADNDGLLTFADNSVIPQTITVQINGDHKVEANETFTVQLGSLSNTTLGANINVDNMARIGTIVNDEIDFGDAPDSYSTLLTSNGARHATVLGFQLGATIDGDVDGQPTVNADGDGSTDDGVTLPGVLVINTTANIMVNASAAGKLDAWVDFNGNGSFADAGEKIFNNIPINAGNNALSFSVPAGATLGTSYARFRLSTSGGLSFNGLASDGEVEDYKIDIVNTLLSIDNPTVIEGNSGTANLVFTVSRNVNVNNCSVDFAISSGTATILDNDYNPLANGTIHFVAGGSLSQSITVVVNGDTKVELNETVIITLSNPINASLASGMGVGTGTITNDDAAIITINNPSIVEGDAGTSVLTFTLNMSNPSDANVSLNYTSMDGTATVTNNDYALAAGTHTFTAGQQVKTVAVTINGDCFIEMNETFIMRLSTLVTNGRNITFSGGGSTLDATGTIINDDALPTIICPINADFSNDIGQCLATVTLSLPVVGSICGSGSLEFRYRQVDMNNTPIGPYSTFATSSSNMLVLALGRYEVQWRITDESGSSSCSHFINIVDMEPPAAVCSSTNIIFNGQTSVVLDANELVTSSDNCGVFSTILFPNMIDCDMVGQLISVMVTVTDVNGNTNTCTASVNTQGLPCGWSQNPNGIGCSSGSDIAYNGTTGVWTATSTKCYHDAPFTSDSYAFARHQLCGDGSITARVTGINPLAQGWAGITMRESTSPGAKKAQLMTNLSALSRREFRTTTNGQAYPQQFQSQNRYWLRITRTGNQFVMHVSPNGSVWYMVGAQNILMGPCIDAGLVVTNYTSNSTITATFSNVSVVNGNMNKPSNSTSTITNIENLKSDVTITPNPSFGNFEIDFTEYLGKRCLLEVYNVDGRMMQSQMVDTKDDPILKLEMTDNKNGIYLVKIKSEGIPDITKRIVKIE